MLLDSYELEAAVIEGDIPARMLRSLDQVQVSGLGLLADGLRKPIAVEEPLLGPDDWRGIGFGVYRSQLLSSALRALGAEPVEAIGPVVTRRWSGDEIDAVRDEPARLPAPQPVRASSPHHGQRHPVAPGAGDRRKSEAPRLAQWRAAGFADPGATGGNRRVDGPGPGATTASSPTCVARGRASPSRARRTSAG